MQNRDRVQFGSFRGHQVTEFEMPEAWSPARRNSAPDMLAPESFQIAAPVRRPRDIQARVFMARVFNMLESEKRN